MALSPDGAIAVIGCPYRKDSGSRTGAGTIFVYRVRADGTPLICYRRICCKMYRKQDDQTSWRALCMLVTLVLSLLACLAAHGDHLGLGGRVRQHRQVRRGVISSADDDD